MGKNRIDNKIERKTEYKTQTIFKAILWKKKISKFNCFFIEISCAKLCCRVKGKKLLHPN